MAKPKAGPPLGITIHMGASAFTVKDSAGNEADLRELCKSADKQAHLGGDMAMMDIAAGLSGAMGLKPKRKRTNKRKGPRHERGDKASR